ncbi:DNA excision repair protein ERCC-3 [Nematocida parisii]|uniref:DNA 3'-5' helicase n=1 Tax=Nematocida parisii (strain ERTm3) TaxID=935791 RepID=I3EKC6_NEMP3|nr:DNA repair helicase rad25 [Nematocida parisii ERTm3]KAI5126843.1 DNA excision repair protein ERCC-3 [Nematocida parisii]KAI5126923.1 DNA excision repair protein ERCC-3 [Nematocida parisii]KAI5141033.1 DNA excision repair protein ERCC-3 [Nematocida parisii]KAI5143373.1 DNA excision repair protein ERCC-3 [Nematocida parisii]
MLPKQATSTLEGVDEHIILKENHHTRPMWVSADGIIILEMHSEQSQQAQDFLIAIAEPVTRPSNMHEYKLTAYSLYAAASVGLKTEDIIDTMDRFSKNKVPLSILNFIRSCTTSYGKIKMVIRQGRYFIESQENQNISFLYRDPVIQELCVPITEEKRSIVNFEIERSKVELAKKRCIELDYPLIEEYDFRTENTLPLLDIDLKPTTSIRTYQEFSLNKMFGNGRARSGIIVLPCGAGKTLVGIVALCTMKRSCLILCTTSVSVEQWKQQIKHFTNVKDEAIAILTSDTKEKFSGQAGIVVSTYTMVSYSGKRSYETQKIMDFLTNTEWGLIIFDEVHVVPANMFRRVVSTIISHCKLGLTATLVREDEKIEDLNFLIGPKLYEADWLNLSAQGHISKVCCTEVWCKMTGEFYKQYLVADIRKKRILATMNPTKIQMCEYIISKHEALGDKIIVFSDNVFTLKAYALKFGKPFIYGPTGQAERMHILNQFRTNPKINTIFLSKVGDTSIDLPEATCLIQISGHFGSRRQETQRLGRILRAKRRTDEGFTAYFYTLVSMDTEEVPYSTRRRQFLIDQGYSFKIVEEIKEMEENPPTVYRTKTEQNELLASILLASDRDIQTESEDDEIDRIDKKVSSKKLSAPSHLSYSEKRSK